MCILTRESKMIIARRSIIMDSSHGLGSWRFWGGKLQYALVQARTLRVCLVFCVSIGSICGGDYVSTICRIIGFLSWKCICIYVYIHWGIYLPLFAYTKLFCEIRFYPTYSEHIFFWSEECFFRHTDKFHMALKESLFSMCLCTYAHTIVSVGIVLHN